MTVLPSCLLPVNYSFCSLLGCRGGQENRGRSAHTLLTVQVDGVDGGRKGGVGVESAKRGAECN